MKLGAEIGVGTVAAGVTKARADHIVIAGILVALVHHH